MLVGWMGPTPVASIFTIVSALLLAAGLAAQTDGRTLVRHEFTSSAEGWEISGDTVTAEPVFRPADGHPGGCIVGVDEAIGETWYFHAPATVLKRLPEA